MAIKENVLPLAQDSGSGYIRTVSSGGVSQRTAFDTVKGAITADMDEAIADEVDAREAADTQLQTEIDGKVDKVTGKGLSTNDFTNALKTKLDGIEAGAEVNVIETVKLNGTALSPDASKAVDVVVPVDAALSDTSVNAVQNKVITGAVNDLKEEINDKPNWTVGSAEQIVSDEASQTDTTPYTFRRSGGGLIPFNFTREELSKVVGGTVAWNQLVGTNSVRATQTKYGVTFTKNADGSISVSGTADSDGVVEITYTLTATAYHKYYVYSGIKNIDFVYDGYIADGKDEGNGGILYWNRTTTAISLYANVVNGTTYNETIKPQLTDLTALFGTTIADYIYGLEQATAGSGIAKLREWGFFRDSYYSYDPGSLQSVCVSGHTTTGKNQLDRTTEENGYISASGVVTTDGVSVHSAPIEVVAGSYVFSGKVPSSATSGNKRVHAYDGDGNWVSQLAYSAVASGASYSVPFTVPSGIKYVKVSHFASETECQVEAGSTATAYEPYESHTYPIEPVTLRGLFKLDANNNLYADGDVYSPDGNGSGKYAEVDMGTLTWSTGTDSTGQYFKANISDAKSSASSSSLPNLICAKYVASPSSSVGEKNIAMSSGATQTLYVRDTTYADAASFKTAVTGTKLVYELATPTTTTADPYTAIQICDSDGTEEFVDALVASGDRDVAIPAGHETVYYENMAGKLADLPPIPSAPSANGTYTLQAVVSSGTVTYQWTS